MVTVKAKMRMSTIQEATGTIYYQLTRWDEIKWIHTVMKFLTRQWDDEKGCVRLQGNNLDPVLQQVQDKIDADMETLGGIVRMLESGGVFSLEEVARRFRAMARNTTLLTYFGQQIVYLKAREKFGTARNYQRTLNSFSCFLQGRDIPLDACTESLIVAYDDWLSLRNVVRNTRSFYMRILRAVYNKAVKQGLVRQGLPFLEVYTGVDFTRKRAMDETYLVRLIHLDLENRPSLRLARDAFLFSYYMRGMSFVDIAYLKKTDVSQETITYVRKKTGQRLSIHMEPCMKDIIQRYSRLTPESPYVFPFVTNDEAEQAFAQYQNSLGRFNRLLKRLGKIIGLSKPLSSYMARHTWANSAREHNIPLPVISAGMGHSSEKTTRIYLASLENSVIDKANRLLLASLGQ